jgi:polar amino acid transport system substrate-binding protein
MALATVVVALVTLFASSSAQPQQTKAQPPKAAQSSVLLPKETIRVATRIVAPLVIEEAGSLKGFSIELWAAIAERLQLKSVYQVENDVATLLATVQDGRADVGIAAISITAERDKLVDFSQPMLAAGLQIMVSSDGAAAGNSPWRDLLKLVFSKSMLGWILMGVLFALIPAHILWYLERNHPSGILASKEYIPGIFQAMWWSVSTLVTQSESMPRHGLARLGAIFWMFTGLVFVAYYTAQLTASLTVQQIRGTINGPDDLPGKRIATLQASTSAAFLNQKRAQVTELVRIEDAYAALLAKKVDAVVFDAPVLQHYASHDGKGRTQVVGNVFRKEDYGIAFPLGSALRKRVDGALLVLREDGTLQRLSDKWFEAK